MDFIVMLGFIASNGLLSRKCPAIIFLNSANAKLLQIPEHCRQSNGIAQAGKKNHHAADFWPPLMNKRETAKLAGYPKPKHW